MAKTSARAHNNSDGRIRAVLENMSPEIDAGRFAIKRVIGEAVVVEVDAFADGHDQIGVALCYRHDREADWREVSMTPIGGDRWRAEFSVSELGRYWYSATAWINHFETWRRDLLRRPESDKDLGVVFAAGAAMIADAAHRAGGAERRELDAFAAGLRGESTVTEKRGLAEDAGLRRLMRVHAERRFIARYPRDLAVAVDRPIARFSAWYEFFPRSCDGGGHGTLRSCEAMLAYVASMGFDIVYLPPIHPIGQSIRKGPNNTLSAAASDVGSPWAIGSAAGGHKAVHPELGTIEDFRRFIDAARRHGLEVALDLAFQCSPDHPYLREHPEWFHIRPDGSIQYAENPPKKYQDIYPFNFESDAWSSLWDELKSVVVYWIDEDVRIFRVDNPHTKAFGFWEWLIGSVRSEYPEVIFLSEAFTRPKVMHRLAKLGFSQSYTYFTWRNTKYELIDYFAELTRGVGREYLRPNLWPNTPDILSEYLQYGGRPAFMARLVLAATLSASYGIYGPAFELAENRPAEPGSEEYLDSEKYQLRRWDLDRPDSLRDFISRVNAVRRDNPALQADLNLSFHPVDNDQLICFSKSTAGLDDIVLVVVNLDPHHRQSGWVDLPLERFGVGYDRPFQVHDLLGDARYLWSGIRNYVELDPQTSPAHIFRLRRHIRRENDFDYFM